MSPAPRRRAAAPDAAAELRYLAFGRVVPAAFFVLLGRRILGQLLQAVSTAESHPSVAALADAARLVLYFLFVSVPILIYIARPRARAQAPGFLPRFLAFAGTFGLLFFPLFGTTGPALPEPPVGVTVATAIGLIFTTGFGLYGLLYLRRSFSIIPEVRSLVNNGPYRIVRHPLYAGEIGSAVLFAIPHPHLWTTLLVIPFIAIQYLRTRYEEALIRSVYPEYASYAQRVGRFFPLLGRRRSNPTAPA